MSERISRIGLVSSVNYKNGTIKVTYPDLDDSVTDDFPVISFNDEYKMPSVGDEVLVIHLSNGMETGFVLGKFWNPENKPKENGKNLFLKELAKVAGEAYFKYNFGTLEIKASNIKLICDSGSTTVADIIEKLRGE